MQADRQPGVDVERASSCSRRCMSVYCSISVLPKMGSEEGRVPKPLRAEGGRFAASGGRAGACASLDFLVVPAYAVQTLLSGSGF